MWPPPGPSTLVAATCPRSDVALVARPLPPHLLQAPFCPTASASLGHRGAALRDPLRGPRRQEGWRGQGQGGQWLVGKYPAIVSPAKEHDDAAATRSKDDVYHNLYLDMNCVIHPCFHPEDDHVCPPMTLDEVFHSMFDYMDRLFRIVRPTSLLYLAVDGVAPRAKMNQQRARRFKSAKAAKDAEIEENLLRDKFRAEGKEVLPREESSEVSDPNVITPGTEFMEKLSEALKYYVRARLSTDPGWKDIKVILSDANVPGEGEHKIMSFIRAQRSREGYDPNTRHCLYELVRKKNYHSGIWRFRYWSKLEMLLQDADLIMLALASHEVHFSILREDVSLRNQQQNCVPITEKLFTIQESVKFKYQFLNVWVLREYLELEMKIPNPVLKTDIERLIDDFVFICLLTGNDFIPHIPSLLIYEGAVDLLIEVYKTAFNKMGGYIVDTDKVKHIHAAYLKFSRLEKFFHELSLYEEKIFLKRYDLREVPPYLSILNSLQGCRLDFVNVFRSLGNMQSYQRKIQRQARENAWNERNSGNVEENLDGPDMVMSFQTEDKNSTCRTEQTDITMNTLELRRNLKDVLRNKQDLIKNGACKRDKIRLGLPGWKARFYKEKFGAETSEEIGKLQNDMVQKYLEGLCWVLLYYFSDVPSWSWYYPFYYAPFASDFKGLSQLKISFTLDKPLRPFDQLMAILPPERINHFSFCSSFALPKCYSKLMVCQESPIHAYYPSGINIKGLLLISLKICYQGVAKLPFIDVKLLLSVTKTAEKDLAVHEVRRNTFRQDKIFMRKSNALAKNEVFAQTSGCSLQKLPIDPATSEMGGFLSSDDDDCLGNAFILSAMENLQDVVNGQAISATFFNPEKVNPATRLLDNVRVPDKTVTEADISVRPLWHTYPGTRPPAVSCPHQHSSWPENLWKPSSPAPPLDEIKAAGTGWMGRGRGNAPAAESPLPWSSRYGRGRGGATVGPTIPRQWSGGYGRGAEDNMARVRAAGGSSSGSSRFDSGGGSSSSYSLRHGGGGGALQRQQPAWRPAGPWGRGGRDGGGGLA
ncbi:hypothetical protein ABZP36_009382 [Zizania latifolia]